MNCPHCHKPIDRTLILHEGSRIMAAKRKTRNGGRKLIGPRCDCGLMTLTRAKARGKSAEHDPNCAFHPSH